MTYAEVTAELQAKHPEVETGKLFGMPCFKARGKALGGEYKGDMVFKLVDEAAQAKAMKLPGAHLFEPMPGHAMKQWVVVLAGQSSHWLELAEAAYQGMAKP